ncbi:PAS domain S-box protein [Flavobacterium sp. '19STA2R22 D10 B1']|uniref:PAS domain S-box protein n=1 Tax=Flavobacterium aerium TaxID=3037261 RepID=UPI00278C1238|nr:PAS domain S-box protein [Flavobacterium sp. '19STA2R22 D10 B1']
MHLEPSVLKILIIENNNDDFFLIKDYLIEEFSNPIIHRTHHFDETKAFLNTKPELDIILLDLATPDNDEIAIISEMMQIASSIPIIILTNINNKELSINSLSLGIYDYLLKEEINSHQLFKSICYSIERKKIIDQLQSSEEKYKKLFENSPIPKFVYDIETLYFLDVNEAVTREYGYTREEFSKLTVKDIVPMPEFNDVYQRIQHYKKHNEYSEGIYKIIKKNGETIDVLLQSNEILFNSRKSRLVVTTNITEKLKSEKEKELTEQRFKALVQEGSNLISILDSKGNYLYVSSNIQNQFGIDPKRLIGKNVFDYIHRDDRERVWKEFEKLQIEKRTTTTPFRYKSVNKKWRWFETIMINMTNNPAVNGLVANTRDVTERIEGEIKIKESTERYEAVAKATNDAIYEYDFSTQKIYIAGFVYKNLFGHQFNKEFIDLEFWKSNLHPDESKEVKNKIKAAAKNSKKKHFEFEYRLRKSNGSYAYVLDKFDIIWENGKAIKKIGALHDISTRKYHETILAFEKEIYELNANPSINFDYLLNHIIDNIEKIIDHSICSIYEFQGNNNLKFLTGKTLSQNIHEQISSIKTNTEGKAFIKALFTNKKVITSNIYKEKNWENHRDIAIQSNIKSCWTFPIKKSNGKTIATLVNFFPIERFPKPDEINILERVSNLIGVVFENRKSAEEIKQAKERYDIVAKATSDTIWDWKIQHDEFTWNKGIQKIYGYKKSDVKNISKWWFDRIHPEDSLKMSVKLYAFLEKKVEKWQDEYRFRCADGSYKYVYDRGFLVFDDNGMPVRMIGAMQDITKQKQEEHRLKLLESVITHAKDSVMITESDTSEYAIPKIVYINEAFSTMSGYTLKELIGKSPLIFNGPDADKQELKKLTQCIQDKKECQIETISYKKNGEAYWVNFSMVPITDSEGKFSHWISIQRDVTERKRQEQEKEQLIQELTQNNKDLRQFSYITSHNLRAPLSNLTGLLYLLDEIPIENQEVSEILNGFKKSTHLLNDTINDLAKVVIIKDNPSIKKEEVYIDDVLKNVFSQVNILLDQHEPIITINLDKAPKLKINKSYLESILLNLLTNAIKYKSPLRKLELLIQTEDHKDYIKLIFQDNGIGLDVERYKDKIFGLYQRFHNYPDSKGLGLYLVKSQVESMGGKIDIKSEVDKGTKFVLKFKKR